MTGKTICITTRVDGIVSYMDANMCIQIHNFDILGAVNKWLSMSDKELHLRIQKAYERVHQYTWNRLIQK